MIVMSRFTVSLDPLTESEVIRQYQNDKDWCKLGDSTVAVVFEKMSPPIKCEAFYMPGGESE